MKGNESMITIRTVRTAESNTMDEDVRFENEWRQKRAQEQEQQEDRLSRELEQKRKQHQEQMHARILAMRYGHGVDVQVKLVAIEKEWMEATRVENKRYERYMRDMVKLTGDLSVEMQRDCLLSHNEHVVCLRDKMLKAQLAVLEEAEEKRMPGLRGSVEYS